MELTKESLELLLQTAIRSAKPLVIKDGMTDGRELLLAIGGEIKQHTLPPKNRAHYVASLEDFILLIDHAAKQTNSPSVWHNENGCVLIWDDDDRRDAAEFKLVMSRALIKLTELDVTRPWFDQKTFIRLLRMELNADAAVVTLFRRMDWRNSVESAGLVERTRESLGRSIESQVSSGSAELPERLTFTIPLYDNPGETQLDDVDCLLEFDPQRAQIQLLPAAGELARVIDRHQGSIRARLDGALRDEVEGHPQIPVFYGLP